MTTTTLSTLKIHKLTQEQYNRELAAGRLDETAIYLTPDSGSSDSPTPSVDTSKTVGVWVFNDTLTKVDADLTQGSVEIDCVGYAPTTYSARPDQFSKINFYGGGDYWYVELYLTEAEQYVDFYSSTIGFGGYEEKTLVFLEEIDDVTFMDWLRANATKISLSLEPELDTASKTVVEAINEVNEAVANVPSIGNIEYMDFTGEGTEIYVEDVGILWDVKTADMGGMAGPAAYFRVPIAAGEGIEFVPGEEGPIVNIGLNEETREAIANMASTSDIPTKVSDLTNDSGFITSYTETDPTVPAWAKTATKPNYTASEIGTNGVAELDASGKIITSQLPSYVDDVLEYSAKSSFPATGEAGKIYVDTSTNKTWRWSGSAYVEISASLALGTTSSTAYRGDRGNTAYTHSQTTTGNPHKVSKSDVGLGNVDNEKQYSASNPPPYPVTKVNNKTGEITLSASDVGALASANYTTKNLVVTYDDDTTETVQLVVVK